MAKSKKQTADTEDLNFGARLRFWRNKLGMTQAEVERRAGLAHNALSRIETGQVDPQFETVTRIAEALGMSFEEVQQRAIPKSSKLGSVEEIGQVISCLESLTPEKRRQVVQAFLQILNQIE
ncbi:MAG: hypothetical protein C5B50_17655 [Verrucomicrobia bacterium]|nr:MAG: hypothetical protein C5B50_17655 [Verrucomicrobiota bacterium]